MSHLTIDVLQLLEEKLGKEEAKRVAQAIEIAFRRFPGFFIFNTNMGSLFSLQRVMAVWSITLRPMLIA